jgi:hypothetical protein
MFLNTLRYYFYKSENFSTTNSLVHIHIVILHDPSHQGHCLAKFLDHEFECEIPRHPLFPQSLGRHLLGIQMNNIVKTGFECTPKKDTQVTYHICIEIIHLFLEFRRLYIWVGEANHHNTPVERSHSRIQ